MLRSLADRPPLVRNIVAAAAGYVTMSVLGVALVALLAGTLPPPADAASTGVQGSGVWAFVALIVLLLVSSAAVGGVVCARLAAGRAALWILLLASLLLAFLDLDLFTRSDTEWVVVPSLLGIVLGWWLHGRRTRGV